jgi:hypothetical protein
MSVPILRCTSSGISCSRIIVSKSSNVMASLPFDSSVQSSTVRRIAGVHRSLCSHSRVQRPPLILITIHQLPPVSSSVTLRSPLTPDSGRTLRKGASAHYHSCYLADPGPYWCWAGFGTWKMLEVFGKVVGGVEGRQLGEELVQLASQMVRKFVTASPI